MEKDTTYRGGEEVRALLGGSISGLPEADFGSLLLAKSKGKMTGKTWNALHL